MSEKKTFIVEEKKKGVYKNLITGVNFNLIRDVLLLSQGHLPILLKE
jgi:hypothetical protein